MATTEFNVSASEVKVKNFEFGQIKEKSVDAIQFNMDKINQLVNRNIDGLIGTQIIGDYDLMIDYNQNKVVFISDRSELKVFDPQDYTITRAPIIFKGNKSFLPMTIAGQEVNMLLDSGANISVLDQKWSETLQQEQQQNTDSQLKDNYTIEQSSIGNVTISDLGLIYRDLSEVQDGFNFDGILSLSSLNADKILFDYKRNRVIFFWTRDNLASIH